MSKVLSAVAWPYANGPRHIGHVAGFGVPSDVFSRYMRMAGHDVLMVSGTDEHGTPILVAADAAGVSPRELADTNNRLIVEDLHQLGLSYDLFTRTTTRNHYAVVQEMFRTVQRNGYMVEQTTKGAISPSTGRTLPDRYIEGTCPICGYDSRPRRPVRQLRQPARPHGPDQPAQQDQRRDARVRRDPALVPRPARPGHGPQGVARRAGGVGDLAAERHQVQPEHPPGDPAARDDPRHRLGHPGAGLGGPADQAALRLVRRGHRLPVRVDRVGPPLCRVRGGEPDRWREWWNDPEALSYYFMGKDNITFHSQIWPAELLAYDGRGDRGGEPGEYGALNLPTEVVSSEFLTMEGKQFSSSRGVVIYVRDMLERYQPDALRYFISAAGPENQDSNFTWAEFVRRTNDELVAGWGNLVNRTATMIAKSFGEIPPAGTLEDGDRALLDTVEAAFGSIGGLIARHRQKAALAEAMRTVAEVNRYVSDNAPWKLKGDDERDRLATILHVTAQAVADCNLLLAPFLPHSANAVDVVLGGAGTVAPMPEIREVEDLDGGPSYPILTGEYSGFPAWARRPVVPGTKVDKPAPVFTKLDPSIVDEELARLAGEPA